MTALEMASTCVTKASPSGERPGTLGVPDLDTICTELLMTGYRTALCTDCIFAGRPTTDTHRQWHAGPTGGRSHGSLADWPDRTGTILSTSRASSLEFTTVSGLTTGHSSVLARGLDLSSIQSLEALDRGLVEASLSLTWSLKSRIEAQSRPEALTHPHIEAWPKHMTDLRPSDQSHQCLEASPPQESE